MVSRLLLNVYKVNATISRGRPNVTADAVGGILTTMVAIDLSDTTFHTTQLV